MAEGHRQRMRKRFYKEGIDSFEPHEVLEMLLYFSLPRVDTNPLAHELIEKFGSFHGVLEANYEDLISFGLTENTVALLKMMPAFSNYYIQSHTNKINILNDCTAVGTYAADKIGQRTVEVFAVICLDVQNRVKNFEILAEGTVHSASISPRKVAECALRNNASRVVLAHNHPGGTLVPSSEDKILTKRMNDMLDAIDVNLLDHVIVANGRFLSMREQHMI